MHYTDEDNRILFKVTALLLINLTLQYKIVYLLSCLVEVYIIQSPLVHLRVKVFLEIGFFKNLFRVKFFLIICIYFFVI